ncbi:MAG: SIR2 family protein, partial [Planctomycetes bacterium]|nr:SIR2 family protein [Planctomycetota bacterium]
MDSAVTNLRAEIAKGRAMIVAGTGVSIATSANDQFASWKGLLLHGIERCVETVSPLPNGWDKRICSQINSGDPVEMVLAASNIETRLGGSQKGNFRKWLHDSVGSLTPDNPALIQAMADLNIPIATTNYDDLISQVTKRRPVTWTDYALTQRWLRNDEEGILHLHGHWEQPASVILGVLSYDAILRDEFTQTLLRHCLLARTLIFIGFGAGLDDPNFSALLEWTCRVLSWSEYQNFRLVRNSELEPIRQQHHADERMSVVGFGDSYDDLVPFLKSLGAAPPLQLPPQQASSLSLQTLQEGRSDFDRRLAILKSRESDISPAEILKEFSQIAFDLYEIGGKRSAWMMLDREFQKKSKSLELETRVRIGTRLLEMMNADGVPDSAKHWIRTFAQDVKQLPDDDLKSQSLQTIAQLFDAMCDYDEAVITVENSITATTDPVESSSLRSHLKEMHFLQGQLSRVLELTRDGGAVLTAREIMIECRCEAILGNSSDAFQRLESRLQDTKEELTHERITFSMLKAEILFWDCCEEESAGVFDSEIEPLLEETSQEMSIIAGYNRSDIAFSMFQGYDFYELVDRSRIVGSKVWNPEAAHAASEASAKGKN